MAHDVERGEPGRLVDVQEPDDRETLVGWLSGVVASDHR
jgi:hypothetical protein